MELVIEPDYYCPSIDENGNYIDKIPSFNNIKHGLKCPCGSRKDKVYETNSTFSSHIKTKVHQKWISHLNSNKANFYIENESLKDTISNQKMIIAKFEKDLNSKNMTIDYLTHQIYQLSTSKIVNNLLDFD